MKPLFSRQARIVGVLVIILLAWGSVSATASSPDTLLSADKWFELTIPPYQIFSNCKKEQIRNFGRGLEQFFAVIDRSWPGSPATKRREETRRLYIFDRQNQFQSMLELSPDYAGRETVRGLFLRNEQSIVLLVDASGSAYPLRILQHELVHDLLGDRTNKVPLWFNEGLAEYFGSFVSHDKEVEIGRPIPSHMDLLQQAQWLDIRELLTVNDQSPIYNEGSKAGVFYAESWALVHYLLLGRPGQDANWRRYVESLDQGDDPQIAFEDAFALDERGLNQELIRYVSRDNWPSERVPMGELKLAKAHEPVPLTPATALCRIGDLVRRMDDGDGNIAEARPWYEAALQRSPGSAEARSALADLERQGSTPFGHDAADQPERHTQSKQGPDSPSEPSRFLSAGAISDSVDSINRLIETHRLEEALASLERLVPCCPDRSSREHLVDWRNDLRTTVNHNRRVSAYNDAVKAYNAGKQQETARILDGITGSDSDTELEAAIRKLKSTLARVKR